MTERYRLQTRWGALKTERSTWFSHYREISDVLLPRSGRYFIQDRNRGNKRNNNIYDSTGTRALRTLAAGMMSGMTSPARPWFRLATSDPELMKYQPVKIWLNDVTRMMLEVFSKSNTYRAFHSMYEELGAFGTGASIVVDDFQNIIHHHSLTAGEYAIAQDYQGKVCTLYREFEMPVHAMVKEFGINNVSVTVKNMYDAGTLDAWVPVVHGIEPRADRDARAKDAKNMPWMSVYFELNADKGKYLREGGFDSFPALVPRWAVSGGDIYGNSPGMEALGDIRQLQQEQLRKSQAIDYQTKPPLQMPTSMKTSDVDTLPGGVSYFDGGGASTGIRSAFDVNLRLDFLLADIQDVRTRINSTFYADLFLMLANGNNSQMTATEVAERHEEKMTMLGPVLERLQNEQLDPMVEMTFQKIVKSGKLPPPPKELQGIDLNVEYVSIMAQAQRAIATNGIDRYVGNLGAMAQIKPDVLDKFDSDQWADIYADSLGIDPNLIVAADKVALIRKDRAAQQAAVQKMQAVESMSQSAANLGTVDTSGKNAASDLMNMFTGYGSPSGVEV